MGGPGSGPSSSFSQEAADEICNAIADGVPLRQYCRRPGSPAWRTVYHWLEERDDFAARFAKARRLGFDAIAEDTMEIGDTPEVGEIITKSEKDGTTIRREDMVAHRKLRVWTRLQLLAKWDPRRYGDLKQVELSGPDGAPLTTVSLNTTDPAEASRIYQTLLSGK